MPTTQADLFHAPAPAVYTDGVHLAMDRADLAGSSQGQDILLGLHDLARTCGLRRTWFQNTSYPHYDLTTPSAARRAVVAGALLLSDWKDYARLAAAPGSRLRPDGWRPTVMMAADALVSVEERNLNLMRLFASGRRVGRRGIAHLGPRAEGNPGS